MIIVIVLVVVVSVWIRRKTEREMEENIRRRKINGDANQPTDNRQGEYSAVCRVENRRQRFALVSVQVLALCGIMPQGVI